jgi:hypothetical protein
MSKQSRTYSGIEYSRCNSVHDLIGAIGQAIKENDMEFELMRREAPEPIDLQEYPENNVKEERQ